MKSNLRNLIVIKVAITSKSEREGLEELLTRMPEWAGIRSPPEARIWTSGSGSSLNIEGVMVGAAESSEARVAGKLQ